MKVLMINSVCGIRSTGRICTDLADAVSDRIGCMSQANVDYILKHNPEIDLSIVEICPNAIDPQDLKLTDDEKKL